MTRHFKKGALLGVIFCFYDESGFSERPTVRKTQSKKEITKTLKINFIRFKASYGVELQSWLSDTSSDVAAIHIHGMSSNGYENYFLDNLREMCAQNRISFLLQMRVDEELSVYFGTVLSLLSFIIFYLLRFHKIQTQNI